MLYPAELQAQRAQLESLREVTTKATKWSEHQDSNLGPSAPKADALPGCAILRNRLQLLPQAFAKQAALQTTGAYLMHDLTCRQAIICHFLVNRTLSRAMRLSKSQHTVKRLLCTRNNGRINPNLL